MTSGLLAFLALTAIALASQRVMVCEEFTYTT
jgi:hypothetical protein